MACAKCIWHATGYSFVVHSKWLQIYCTVESHSITCKIHFLHTISFLIMTCEPMESCEQTWWSGQFLCMACTCPLLCWKFSLSESFSVWRNWQFVHVIQTIFEKNTGMRRQVLSPPLFPFVSFFSPSFPFHRPLTHSLSFFSPNLNSCTHYQK